MSLAKRVTPKVKSLTTTIILPTSVLLAFNYPGIDTASAEQYFAELAKYQDEEKKVACQDCQKLLQHAGSCHAELKKVATMLDSRISHGVGFTFGFLQIDDLEKFISGLENLLD